MMTNITTKILIILGLMFIFQMSSFQIENLFVFVPTLAFSEPWRFLTSIFLHGGAMHLFFNAYALFLFGSILERKISKKNYLAIFFGAGLVGSFLYYLTYLFGIIPSIPALGASGAIFGILGAVAVLMPDLRIFVLFMPMRMKHAAFLWLAIEIFGTFNMSQSLIGSAAHLGGLLFGLAYAWYLKNKIQTEVVHGFVDPWD